LGSGLAILLLIVGFSFVQPAQATDLIVSRTMPMEHQRDLLMTFFLTSMLFLLLWAILNYIQDRQPEVGLFAIQQAVYTLFAIAATGYLSPFFPTGPPQLLGWASAFLYLAINFTTLLFCRELFKLYDPPPFLMRGLNLLMGTFPVLIVVLVLGYNTAAINSNAALIQITWLVLAVSAIAFREEGTPRRWIMQAFFVAVCVCHAAFWIAGRSGRIASTFNLSDLQLLIFDGLAISGIFVVILKARALHGQRKAQQSFLDLMRVRKKFEMELELKKQAELEAQTDFLTGLFNRRRFVESAESELDRAMRFQRPLSLLMFDIDHFKSINDTWGHAMGDVVLQQVAHLLHDALRNADILGRTGGEEFAAVLVETEGNAAANVAQRLCATVADAVIAPPEAGRIPVTVSIGLTQLKGRSISFDELLNEADQAMYAAKQAGRNRISVSNMGADLNTAARSNPGDSEAGKEQQSVPQTGPRTVPRTAAL
jgi:diguanylate cyclase (GGDEF)-like protein